MSFERAYLAISLKIDDETKKQGDRKGPLKPLVRIRLTLWNEAGSTWES